MTNLELIAKRAGVSRGTVDRVLHNRGQVKPETAERVRAVMAEMNFQPSTLGRALFLSRKKNKIGVLVGFREPDMQEQVMQGVTEGIAYAQQHGIEVLVEYIRPDNIDGYVESLKKLAEDGVRAIAARGVSSDAIRDCLQELSGEMQIISFNEDFSDKSLRDCFVGQDSRKAGRCAGFLMEQIADKNSKILLIGVDPSHSSSEERLSGFTGFFCERRKDAAVSQTVYGEGSHELTRKRTLEKIKTMPELGGIFVSGAGLSGAAHAVEDAGLAQRIKIIGFDSTESNVHFLRRGTVQFLLDQGTYQQGYQPIRLLTDSIFSDKLLTDSFVDTGIQIKTPLNL